jgi:polyisoprenoid-binding protein YceI
MSNRTITILRTHDDREIPAAGFYEIDGTHTSVEFIARHLMITKVRGRFNDVRGRITIGEDPEDSRVEVEIGASSVSTGNDDRDTHLRSPDFFDVQRFPTITFTSTAVRSRLDGSWDVDGELTVRDTSRSVPLRVTFDGAVVSPFDDERIGFSATGELNREDFGLTWNVDLATGGLLVAKVVHIELSIEAIARGDASGTP